ncbi:helix-turn-helix domain-containing protein [Streptomyces sp. NPDC087219]|uniref:helix-turn-helix domain-containing protein n=1 Tax=Streptomyces sp. NPDC087219 TaxID=3365770 RepID=UPI00380A5DD5
MEVSRRLRIAPDTVRTWRRFIERGLDGLFDHPRPGAPPRKITDADVEQLIVKTLDETPKNATHWSTRSMAAATGMALSTVSRIWRALALAPHLSQPFKLSTDPLFIDKVRDVMVCTSIRRRRPWCSAWMRSRRSRPWTGPSRSCRRRPAFPNAAATTTPGPAPPPSSPPWRSPPARSSTVCLDEDSRQDARLSRRLLSTNL